MNKNDKPTKSEIQEVQKKINLLNAVTIMQEERIEKLEKDILALILLSVGFLICIAILAVKLAI
ncbi:MAG: hypothetical protein NC320_13155 [Clostridium sp.]|nr:hypothetical protein [Clostridium sp.]